MKIRQARKYIPYPGIELPDRTWPDRTIDRAPVWCSVDLRDGNQALAVPMGIEAKLEMFQLLVEIGFKEIEVGFPSASEIEYRFLRKLIEEDRIPDDVTIQVLTPAREHLIEKTFEALVGAKQAIVHLYNSTSTLQREVVFKKDREEIKAIAVAGAELMRELKAKSGSPGIRFEYSPESFTGTEPEYALEVCRAVMEVWNPTPADPVILNLPATVEMAAPNIYADQIEWFCRRLDVRDSAIVSIHTHNDRGTAVAAAELALLAGGDRVEGTLFGNGERTGNLDIVTMALNLFSQGIDPGLDFSRIERVREVYSAVTGMEVHPRHPYAGELVFTAFSGSHQDAISKGMEARREGEPWAVPYLPIDPADIGRSYERIIRINSQSGKGGIGYVMEAEFGFRLPKELRVEFSRLIQEVTDRTGRELTPEELRKNFRREYLDRTTPYSLKKCRFSGDEDGRTEVAAEIEVRGRDICFKASGNGPIDAFVRGLGEAAGLVFTVASYSEHDIDHSGSAAAAAAYISLKDESGRTAFGVGVDTNISLASIKAILSALNRLEVINHRGTEDTEG
ncbi:MAG: 2-isopropylmalate synthase [Candidatus Erginobacter occultus]|nr:2-isopropylmalate synthase [Candidatus Erginobacter occultus]